MKTTFAVAALALIAGSAMGQVNLATWTFDNFSIPAFPGNQGSNWTGPVADSGVNAAGTVSAGFHALATTQWTTPVGNGSAKSWSSQSWSVGDYYQFTVSTLGFNGISVAWDQTRSGTGPADFVLEFSTDGTNFTPVVSSYPVAPSGGSGTPWNSTTRQAAWMFAAVNLPAAADNQSAVTVRYRALTIGSSTNGTNRIDNVVINAVPTPGSVALLGMAGLIAGRRRRAV